MEQTTKNLTPQSNKKSKNRWRWVNDFCVEYPPQWEAEKRPIPAFTLKRPMTNEFYIKINAYLIYMVQRLMLNGVIKNYIIDGERDDITIAIQGTTGNYYYYSLNHSNKDNKSPNKTRVGRFFVEICKGEGIYENNR